MADSLLMLQIYLKCLISLSELYVILICEYTDMPKTGIL